MTRWRIPVAALSALALLLGSTTTGAASTPQQTPPVAQEVAQVPRPTGSTQLTLITGDRVTYQFLADGTPVDAEVAAAPRENGRPLSSRSFAKGTSTTSIRQTPLG